MTIELAEEPMTALPEYARIPIVFTVDHVLDVTSHYDGPGGFALSERSLEVPYEKDYDGIAGEGPLQWARRFDLSNWALFTARFATRVVGGATVAFDTPGLTLLEGRRDLAVLARSILTFQRRSNCSGTRTCRQFNRRAHVHHYS